MRIQNNIPGMRGLRYGKKVNSETSKTLEKLSSGYRINRASDDAAGLAVSERIRACLTGYDRCEDNVREGIDLAATADRKNCALLPQTVPILTTKGIS